MTKKIIISKKAPSPVGPYSQAISCGNILYVSGQIPIDPVSGEVVIASFEKQCHRVLLNLKNVIEAGGSSLNNAIKITKKNYSYLFSYSQENLLVYLGAGVLSYSEVFTLVIWLDSFSQQPIN